VKWLPSFRSRVVTGSVLFGLGLLLLTHVASVLYVRGHDAFGGLAHIATLVTVASLFIAGGVWVSRSGLSAFGELRARLSAVHEGREGQVVGRYPTEVQPLVDDLNALLVHRDRRVREALAKAGDLAHGLKTPLAVLAHEADRCDAEGRPELGAIIRQEVQRMERQVGYHLAHARAAASGATPGTRCAVIESVSALVRTLQRLHAGRGLSIEVNVAPDHAVRGQREDLDEMLGNLLDNACKWAKSRVAIASSNSGGSIVITVDDDGPGLAVAMRARVMQRGVRADEAAPGTGFGLAIVHDLATVYGGSITLDSSPLGGLRAQLQLPSAESV